MNQLVSLAKTMTIRDMQLDEKKEFEFKLLEEDRRLDEQLEAERLKALAMYETRDVKRLADRQYGAQVLKMQMGDRERLRLRELAGQEREREAMVAQIDSLKAEEAVALAERREQNRRLLEEVALANAEQIRTKNKLAAAEKEDERRILLYNRERDARERALGLEKERVRVEKEAEVERMRAAQQRMADVQSGIDQLRMRRADEEAERAWRRKEKAEAERLRAVHAQLSEAREAQREEKVRAARGRAVERTRRAAARASQRASDGVARLVWRCDAERCCRRAGRVASRPAAPCHPLAASPACRSAHPRLPCVGCCACVPLCVRACLCACVRASVRACVPLCVRA
jgi:hypothetical protein